MLTETKKQNTNESIADRMLQYSGTLPFELGSVTYVNAIFYWVKEHDCEASFTQSGKHTGKLDFTDGSHAYFPCDRRGDEP